MRLVRELLRLGIARAQGLCNSYVLGHVPTRKQIILRLVTKTNATAVGAFVGAYQNNATGTNSLPLVSKCCECSAVAFGEQTRAQGTNSFTAGFMTTAANRAHPVFNVFTSPSSFAMGYQTSATGQYSVALGQQTLSRTNALTAGYINTASGQYSVAFGQNNPLF